MDSKEMFENKKIELQDIDKIVRVKHSPAVSTFISLIKTVPCFLDLFDDSLEYILQNFQNKKQQQLLDFINNTFLIYISRTIRMRNSILIQLKNKLKL